MSQYFNDCLSFEKKTKKNTHSHKREKGINKT